MLTRTAGAAITRGQALKITTGDVVVACAGDTDTAVYIAMDNAAPGEHVPCATLGNTPGTLLVLATTALTPGAAVGVLGQAAASDAVIIGRALESGAAGEEVEIAHNAARILE